MSRVLFKGKALRLQLECVRYAGVLPSFRALEKLHNVRFMDLGFMRVEGM